MMIPRDLFNHTEQSFKRQRPLLGVGMQDEPTTCFRVNNEWAKYVVGAMSELLNIQAWQDAEDERYAAIQQLIDVLIGEPCGETEVPTIFRQSPDNVCLLEQSIDSGETWLPAFNFSSCIRRNTDDIRNYTNNQTFNELNEIYDGTVDSIAPDLVYDESPADIWRDDLVCLAIRVVITSMMQAEADRRDQNANVLSSLGDFFLATAALLFAPTGGGSVVVGALGALFILAGAALRQLTNDQLIDFDAINAVACCAYQGLRGKTVTESVWNSVLTDCDFNPELPEAQIAFAMQQFFDTSTGPGLNFYLAFLAWISELAPLAEQDLFDDCPCEVVCQTYDFVASNGGWTTTNVVYNSPGHYSSGVGWVGDESSLNPIGGGQYWVVMIKHTFTDQAVDRIRMQFDWILGQSDFNHTAYAIEAWRDDGLIAEKRILRNDAVDGTDKLLTLDVQDTIDEIRLTVVSGHFNVSVPSPTGTATIKILEVTCPT